MSQQISLNLTDNLQNYTLVLDMWNYYQLFANNTHLQVQLNDKIFNIVQHNSSDLITNFLNVQTHEDDIVHTCEVGTNNFLGYMRHLILSQGLNNPDSYRLKYMHSLPTPLDRNLISYYSMEDYLENTFKIDINNIDLQVGIEFDESNELDTICRCEMDDILYTQESSQNYAYLHDYSYIDPIQINTSQAVNGQQYINKIELDFSVYFEEVLSVKPINLISHGNLWNLTIFNKTVLNLAFNNQNYNMTFTDDQTFQDSIYLSSWLTYQISITENQLIFELNDFTNQDLTQIITLDQTFQIDLFQATLLNPQQYINISSDNLVYMLRSIDYSVNALTLLSQNFTRDTFIQTTDEVFTNNDKNKQKLAVQGYFSNNSSSSGQEYNITSSKLQFKQIRGPCNQSDSNYGFDGLVCRDNQKFLSFNSEDQSSGNSVLQGYVQSSNGFYTFEAWIKFSGFLSSDQQNAVIMSNYQTLTNPMIIIQIFQNGDQLALECNPYYQARKIPGYLDSTFLIGNLQQDKWLHIACVSNNDLSDQWLKLYSYDHSSQNIISNFTANSHTLNLPNGQQIRTLIGNLIDYSSPFSGMIKEVRMWNEARTQNQLEQYRYQQIPNVARDTLVVYSMINNGYGNRIVDLSFSQIYATDLFTFSKQSPLSYVQDSEINVCPVSTIYSVESQCCLSDDFDIVITRNMSEDEEGNNQIVLQAEIEFIYLTNMSYDDGNYVPTWALKNLEDLQNGQQTQEDSLDNLLQQIQDTNNNESFVLSITEDFLSQSTQYIFEISITSSMRNYNKTVSTSISITPQCPNIEIKPTYNANHQITVYKYMNPSNLVLDLELLTQCHDQLDSYQVTWQSTSKSSNLYVVDPDTYQIQFQTIPDNLDFVYLTATLSYSINGVQSNLSDYVMVLFDEEPIVLAASTIPERIKMPYPYFEFDPFQTQVTVDYYNSNDLVFEVECPISLFSTYEDYNEQCQIDQDTAEVSLNMQDLNIIMNAQYEFKYSVTSQFLNFTTSSSLLTSFYKTEYLTCPIVSMPQYTYFTKNQDIMLFKPYISLDCRSTLEDTVNSNVTTFNITYSEWKVDGFDAPTQFLNISQDNLVAYIREDYFDSMQPGFSTVVRFNVQIENQWFNTSTNMLLKKSVVDIVSTNNIIDNQVSFNQLLIIDATQSYDPDYTTASLSYNWIYSSQYINSYNFANGLTLQMTPFDRLQLNMRVGLYEYLTLDIMNPTYSESRTQQNFNFLLQKYDTTKQTYNGCYLDIMQDISNLNYSYINITDLEFDVTLDSTACMNLKSDYQQYYVFIQESQNPYTNSASIKVDTSTLTELRVGQQYPIDFVYLFSTYKNDVLVYDYIVKSIVINKVQSPLIINFTGGLNYQVGQEETLTLDASNSFDPDTNISRSFKYFWICPNSMYCTQNSASQFVLTKLIRQQANLNSIGDTFQIGLRIQLPNGRQSQNTYVNISIIEQDYQQCLDINLSAINGQVTVKRDQIFPYEIRLYLDYQCDNVNIVSIDWSTVQVDISQFWVNSLDGQSITLKSAQVLPQNINSVDFQVVVAYNGSDWSQSQISQQLNFTLNLNQSDLIPVINLPSQVIYYKNSDIIIDATQSYDPDNLTALIMCQFVCPNSIVTDTVCQASQNNCLLQIPHNNLQVPANSEYLNVQFEVSVYGQDNSKMATQSVYITLVNDIIANTLPLCGIQTNKLSSVLIDDKTILYPSCQFQTDQAKKLSQFANYQFLWKISAYNQNYSTQNYSLSIMPFNIQDLLGVTNFSQLNVSLIIQDINNSSSPGYEIQNTYNVPNYQLTSDLDDFYGYVKTLPSKGYTLFSSFLIEIMNYTLFDNEYFRLRVQYADGSQELLLNKAYNYSYLINFPKHATKLFVDVVSGQLTHGNDYNVYVMETQVFVEDFKFLTFGAFNQLVIPQLQQDIQITDYSDLAQIQLQLNSYFGLMTAISRMNSQDLQQNYMQTLLNKFLQVYNNIQFQYFNDEESMILNNLLMKTASLGYQKIASIDFQFYDQVLSLIQNQLLTENIMVQLFNASTNYRQQNDYLNSIYSLITNSIIPIDQNETYTHYFYQLLSSQLVQGQYKTFTSLENDGSLTTIQKLKDLDIQGLQPLIINSPIANDSSNIQLNASQFPSNVIQIQLKYQQTQENSNYTDLMKTYNASRSQVQINLMDIDFENVQALNVGANVQFQIQQSLRTEIQYMSNLTGLIQCISKSDDALIFDINDTSITADQSQLKDGFVTCMSPHLSVFDILYVPRVEYYTIDYKPYQDGKVTMFMKIPILRYIVPGVFLTFVFLMFMIGKIMEQLDKNRPQRYYNKLSMNENIKKHSYIRLLGAMILQFNPFFNYVIKKNDYLNRPIRLLILSIYFLIISSISVLIFMSISNETMNDLIFVIAFVSTLIFSFLRPRVQNMLFSLFYPKSLKRWRYQASQNQQENERMIDLNDDDQLGQPSQRQQHKIDILDQSNGHLMMMNDSIRLENSMNRILGQSQHDFSQVVSDRQGPTPLSNDDTIKGDEILKYRKAKSLKRQGSQGYQGHDNNLYKKTKKLKKKQPSQRQNQMNCNDIEMQNFTPTKKDNQDNNDCIQSPSFKQNLPRFILSQNKLDLTQLQENEGIEIQVLDSNENNANAQKQISSIKDQNGMQNSQSDDLQIVINDDLQNQQQYEGGDKEVIDQDVTLNINYYEESKANDINKPKKSKKQGKPKKPKQNMEDIDSSSSRSRRRQREEKLIQNEQQFNQDIEDNNSQNDESTPSLEGIFENYRTLDVQKVPLYRKLIGTCLLMIVCFSLIFVHAFLMPQLQEAQFQNWFTCTAFTFILQIFVIDTLLYVLITCHLKKHGVQKGGLQINNGCSRHLICVYIPLGKYKYEELEIELAKLKDFDAEYNLLRYL